MASPAPGTTPKAQVRYRLATVTGMSCGTCSMEFRRGGQVLCTLVAGTVRDQDVCDEWQQRRSGTPDPDISWGGEP